MCYCCYRYNRTYCCPCIWRHCRFCAKHIYGIRILLVFCSLIDIVVMAWYIWASIVTSDEIVNCCGTSHGPHTTIYDTNLTAAYSECDNLNYANVLISDYSRLFLNAKKYNKLKLDELNSIFTYYDINVSVSNVSGGCIINQYDCFSDAVSPCIMDEYGSNKSFANKTVYDLQTMCQQQISETQQLYTIGSILAVVVLKIILIIIGICSKLCRNEFKPQNEALHSILNPVLCPKLIEKQKDKSYSKMKDEKDKHQYKLLWVFWNCIKYSFLFLVLLFKFIWWTLRKSYFLMIYMANFACSVDLFFIHNSPILGIDSVDFCVNGGNQSCVIGQSQCGIISWIILPDISKYLIPRYITLTVSTLACFGRIIEKFAVCKLIDMIKKRDEEIIKELHINNAILPEITGNNKEME